MIAMIILTFNSNCKKDDNNVSSDTTLTTSTVIDIDGNVYNLIKIGNQVWMAENLKVTHYQNGDSIPQITTNAAWAKLTTGAYCNFNNNETMTATYGHLYNWYAVTDPRNIAPAGWHVPTDAEWTELTAYLGGETVAGGKLKEAGTAHWTSPNVGATNSSKFTALSAGSRNSNGGFEYFGTFGDWWTSTESGSTNGSHRGIANTDSAIYNIPFNKNYGFSVRCVKD